MRALTFLIFPLLIFGTTLAFAAGWAGFVAPDAYSYGMPTGEVTWSATGDLNGDGFPEVVVAEASYVQVMVNHAGVLTAGAKYTVGSTKRVLVADMNLDGRLDVIAVGNLTAVLLGKGDGTLQTPTLLSGLGDDAAMGDINRDGYPDLVVASAVGVQVRFNNQHGSFGAVALVAAIPLTRVRFADLNGDGNGDIVGASGNLVAMLGRGGGTFATPFITTASVASFAIADANRDGVADIFYAGNGPAGILLGNGDGSFRACSPVQVENAQAVSVGDFNGDGWMDMAVSGFAMNLYGINVPTGLTILLGDGQGTLIARKSYAFGGAQDPAADMNVDGRLDLVIGGIAIALGNGDGSFRAVEQVSTGVLGVRQTLAADFRRDGGTVFAIVGQDEQVRVFGRVVGQWTNSVIPGLRGHAVSIGDFDGDGLPDVVAVSEDGFIATVSGNGDLSFGAARKSPAGTAAATFVESGKLDGDHLDDVIAGSGSTLELLLASGLAYFAPPVSLNLENGDAVGAAISDLNLDGGGDIVVRHDYGFTVLQGDASGKYFDQRYIEAAGKTGGFVLQDLNGDAVPDLIYTASTLGKIYVLMGDGAGNFTLAGSYSVLSPADVTAGDVNGDGSPDLIVCSDNGGLATLLGTAQHTFSAASYWYANAGQTAPALADVTHDGVPDVVTLDAVGAFTLFENRGFVQAVSPSVTSSANVLDFGSQTIQRASTAQTVKLTNTGNVNLSLRLSVTGDFTESDTCGHELRVGAACMVTFTFRPTQLGTQSTVVQVANGMMSGITLLGVGLDITASGTRPGRPTRPVSPAPDPVAAKPAAAVLLATIVPEASSSLGGRNVLPIKNSFVTPHRDVMCFTCSCTCTSQHVGRKDESMRTAPCACIHTSEVRLKNGLRPQEVSNETASDSDVEGRSAGGRRHHLHGQRRVRSRDLHRRHECHGRTLHEPLRNPGSCRSGVRIDDGSQRTREGRHHGGVH
jgi:hypothetical protein